MSGVPIQLSGDTLYMSSTLIKVMLFIQSYKFVLRGTLSHTDSQFLYTGLMSRGRHSILNCGKDSL